MFSGKMKLIEADDRNKYYYPVLTPSVLKKKMLVELCLKDCYYNRKL